MAVAGTSLTLVAGTCAAALGSGGWSTARQVPSARVQGLMTVYTAPAYVGVSCPAPRDCTVAYIPPGGGASVPVFGVTEHAGTWGAPRPIPGLRSASLTRLALACISPGDCIAAATAPHGRGAEVMVARLNHGVWGKARPVPGLAALHAADSSQVSALACGRAGWCALAGQYRPPIPHAGLQPFVVSEHDGAWSNARPVPGLPALTQGWTADVAAISCDPQGTCTAAGDYRDHAVGDDQPFAVTDSNGRWGPARPITGTEADGPSFITAISCNSPGDCTAAGTSFTPTLTHMFVVTETAGTWQQATPLRGTIALSYPADTTGITALTCTAPGQCAALGGYGSSANSTDSAPVVAVPFAAAQAHGTWSAIRAIRGLPADAVAFVTSVSCSTAGDCAAGGYWFTNPNGDEHTLSNNHAFLATETRGTWGRAQPVPGLAALRSWVSKIDAVSCQPLLGCIAVGDYVARGHRLFTAFRG
jgi:hypothetical protein